MNQFELLERDNQLHKELIEAYNFYETNKNLKIYTQIIQAFKLKSNELMYRLFQSLKLNDGFHDVTHSEVSSMNNNYFWISIYKKVLDLEYKNEENPLDVGPYHYLRVADKMFVPCLDSEDSTKIMMNEIKIE